MRPFVATRTRVVESNIHDTRSADCSRFAMITPNQLFARPFISRFFTQLRQLAITDIVQVETHFLEFVI